MVRGKTERDEGEGGEMSKLTRNEIMTRWDASTSRERDVWVAEKVMGWKGFWTDGKHYMAYPPNEQSLGVGYDERSEVWNFSTEISAAMEIVEKLKRTKGFRYFRKLTFGFILGEKTSEKEPMLSLPEAICKAALLVMGDES